MASPGRWLVTPSGWARHRRSQRPGGAGAGQDTSRAGRPRVGGWPRPRAGRRTCPSHATVLIDTSAWIEDLRGTGRPCNNWIRRLTA